MIVVQAKKSNRDLPQSRYSESQFKAIVSEKKETGFNSCLVLVELSHQREKLAFPLLDQFWATVGSGCCSLFSMTVAAQRARLPLANRGAVINGEPLVADAFLGE